MLPFRVGLIICVESVLESEVLVIQNGVVNLGMSWKGMKLYTIQSVELKRNWNLRRDNSLKQCASQTLKMTMKRVISNLFVRIKFAIYLLILFAYCLV